MPFVIYLLALCGFAISLPAVWLLIRLGERFNKVDAPDAPGGRKDHARPIVNIGGVGIVWAVLIPLVGALAGAWLLPASVFEPSGLFHAVGPYVEGFRSQTQQALWLIGAILVMHVMGLVDDRVRLSAWPKLLIQIGVALGLVLGAKFRVLEFLDHYGPAGHVLSVTVTVLWIGVLTNALNFLDNMDGLAAGVGTICGSILVGAAILSGQWFVAGLAAMLVGALLGFLVHNFPPARVYMGDGGSLVLGLLLSVLAIRLTYTPLEPTAKAWPALHALLTPLVILAIPLYDFMSVSGIRILQGKSPMVGDQQHFSHRLVKMGMSRRTAVLVIWACTLATGISGLMLPSLPAWQAALAFVQTLAILAVLAALEFSFYQKQPPAKP